jgi:hypothetical protein
VLHPEIMEVTTKDVVEAIKTTVIAIAIPMQLRILREQKPKLEQYLDYDWKDLTRKYHLRFLKKS